jgi:hypothetical protein
MVLAILQANGTALLKQVSLIVPELRAHYRTVLNVPADTQETATFVDQHHTICRVLVNIFSNSCEELLSQQRENELSISLRKKAKENLQGAATEASAIEGDTEMPASKHELQDIGIRASTEIADKDMNSLRQVATKTGRGANPRGPQ